MTELEQKFNSGEVGFFTREDLFRLIITLQKERDAWQQNAIVWEKENNKLLLKAKAPSKT